MRVSLIATLLAVALLSFSGCHHLSFVLTDGYRFDYQGQTATKTDSGDILADASHIAIDHRFGDVIVTTSTDNQPRWEWSLKTWATDQMDAEGYLEMIELRTHANDGTESFSLALPEEAPLLRGVESILTLYVPSGVSAETVNRHGDTRLANLANKVDLTNAHGNTVIENITGDCSVENRHGNTTVSNVGSIRLKAHHGNTTINGAGDLTDLEVHHGNLKGANFAGLVKLDIRHGDADLAEILGDAEVESHHGDIEIDGVDGKLSIQTHHGDAKIILDSSASPSIKMDAQHGTILSDFPTDGNGPEINAKSRHGNLRIQKR